MPDFNTGDTAWVLAAAALVLFMTPGLALFYGGMVRTKNVLAMLMQNIFAMGIVTGTLWRVAPTAGWTHQLSFGPAALAQDRWWTFLTGAFALPRPEFYAVVGTIVVAGLGAYERRVGWLRAPRAVILRLARIKGALNIPLLDLSQHLAEVPKQVPVVLY